ncbi:hypothetical protein D3C85_969260 [compost metagenome]
MGKAPAQSDLADVALRAILEEVLTHGGQAVLPQVGHRRQAEILGEAFVQLEARYAGGLLDVFEVHFLAGVGLDEVAGAHQVVRQLDLQALAQLPRVVVRLGEDQALDQRVFHVPREVELVVEIATALQFVGQVANHPPPGRRAAVDRVHLRLEAERHIHAALQQILQGLVDGRLGNGDLQLAAVAGDGQLLMLEGHDDHPAVPVGAQQPPGLGQLLLARQRQAEAVAIELHVLADADGHVGAVLDVAENRGGGAQHVAAVVELDALGLAGPEYMRTADFGHPGARSGEIEAIGNNIPEMQIVILVHRKAPVESVRSVAL